MIRMQGLTSEFNAAHPDIQVNWVTLEENILRERVTTDIATRGGQYDLLTIGNYEVPIWGKQGWLTPLEFDASYDVDDLLPAIRGGLTVDGNLYAAPFNGEFAFLMYRTDLFEAAGLAIPESPTWEFIGDAARKLTDRDDDISGICLRGKAGWGENMAFITALANSYGGAGSTRVERRSSTPSPGRRALQFYVDMMEEAGPTGASSNGFNENLTLFQQGKCAMWIDATTAGSFVSDPNELDRRRQGGVHDLPGKAGIGNHGNWLWSWNLAIPASSKNAEAAKTFIEWATSKEYTELVASKEGWANVPPGTRTSLYENPDYRGSSALRRADEGGDGCGRYHQADRRAGALHRRPVRRDPRVPEPRHFRRSALLPRRWPASPPWMTRSPRPSRSRPAR